MSYETVRISELAKELGLPSKEVVEKFAQIGVTNKTHSSTVTQDQIARLKDFIAKICRSAKCYRIRINYDLTVYVTCCNLD